MGFLGRVLWGLFVCYVFCLFVSFGFCFPWFGFGFIFCFHFCFVCCWLGFLIIFFFNLGQLSEYLVH